MDHLNRQTTISPLFFHNLIRNLQSGELFGEHNIDIFSSAQSLNVERGSDFCKQLLEDVLLPEMLGQGNELGLPY
jgi:hypothetical protein